MKSRWTARGTRFPGPAAPLGSRVSFGSSKGSMVETVVYDYEPAQPLREEDGTESPTPRAGFTTSTPLSTPASGERVCPAPLRGPHLAPPLRGLQLGGPGVRRGADAVILPAGSPWDPS
ncbi:hypothetical protein FJT64_008213 [Amphibalanus amphitrite]|uniref:Uncharacterized protein n=1 Tax=Amphibalanus amphitrite TaxID=1232801 RepID=A0A6A4VK96_AMPAM|nr:hypothetical protein FJT64_008213 [Amphibalanus amphitrite]